MKLLRVSSLSLLLGLALFLFLLLLFTVPRFFNCYRSRGVFPHVVSSLLNLEVKLRVLTRGILRINYSKAVVRKLLMNEVRIKSYTVTVFTHCRPFVAVENFLLFLFLSHFPQFGFALLNR